MAVLSRLWLFSCWFAQPDQASSSEKHLTNTVNYVPYKDDPSKAELAAKIVTKLFTAEKNDAVLRADLKSVIHEYGWYDGLAAAILAALVEAIKLGDKMGEAIKAAYEKAVAAVNKVKEWAEAHPKEAAIIITLIAIGILCLMMPWLLSFLGFTEDGILEASWAAGWQSTYRGFVPKGSLFSYLQSLGTQIGRNWHG